MRWLSILSLLIAPLADAADFRVLDFGSSCATVNELEASLGSVQILWSKVSPDLHTFSGSAFDRQVSIVYLCPRGNFEVGNYFFASQSPDDAVKTYRRLHDALVVEYGVPYIDNSPWQTNADTVDPRSIASDPSKYIVAWRDERTHRTMAFRRDDETTSANLSVAITVGRRKL
jgi:hypothetical protein